MVVDAGNALHRPRQWDADGVAQARITARTVAQGLVLGRLDAMAIGEHDLWLGLPVLEALAQDVGLPIVSSNLTCDGRSPFPPSMRLERAGLVVGIVGVTTGSMDGCEISDPRISAESALDALGDVDVAVLLAPLPERLLSEWAGQGSDFDVVVSGAASIPSTEAVSWADGHLVQTGTRGKHVGMVTLRSTAGSVSVSDNTLVPLSEEVADHPATAALVAEGKTALSAAEAQPERPIDQTRRRVTTESVWAGRDTCTGCHAEQDAQWRATPHAHAWTTLDAVGNGLDRSCVGCHVTGWEQDGGPSAPADMGPFRDVQCEACHGPSAAHVAEPPAHTPVKSPAIEVCTACHDGERDAGRFDADEYLPRVMH